MKRLIAIMLVFVMAFAFAACNDDSAENTQKPTEEKISVPDTTGGHFVNVFLKNQSKSLEEIADAILKDSGLGGHVGQYTTVNEGRLWGFGTADITGFDKGVLFRTDNKRVPFIGYVFELSDNTDAEQFKQTLLDNADLNFNESVKADEVIVQDKGDKVVVIITPEKIEEVRTEDVNGNPVEGEVPVYGGSGDDFE